MESGLLVGDKGLYLNEFDEPNRDNIFRRIEITKEVCERRLKKLNKFFYKLISDETSREFQKNLLDFECLLDGILMRASGEQTPDLYHNLIQRNEKKQNEIDDLESKIRELTLGDHLGKRIVSLQEEIDSL